MIQFSALISGFLIGLSGTLICLVLYFFKKFIPIRLNLKKLGNLPNLPLILIWFFTPLLIFDRLKHNEAYLHSPYFYYGEIWSVIGGAIGLTAPFIIFSLGMIRIINNSKKTERDSRVGAHEKFKSNSLERIKPNSLTMNEENKTLKVLVPLILGVIALGYTAFNVFDNYNFYSKALSANAEIIKAEKISGGKGGHWTIDLKFLNESKELIDAQVKSYRDRGVNGYQTGDKIIIFYLSNNSRDVRLKEWDDIFMTPIFFFIIGLILIFGGLKRTGKI